MQTLSYAISRLQVDLTRIAAKPEKCFIEVKKGNVHLTSFEMKKDLYTGWRIVEPAPEWVDQLVPGLRQVIEQNEH